MIEQITQLEKISRFKAFSSNVVTLAFKRANLIYAPNARGKTTVADIISSVASNNVSLLDKRRSKVYTGTPAISVKHSNPQVTSRYMGAAAWTNPITDTSVIIFDKNFIEKNIHTTTVEHDHKKNLHELIVGENAIEAKEDVKQKRTEAHEAIKRGKELNVEFSNLHTKQISIEDFIKLEVGDTSELTETEKGLASRLEALGDPDSVKRKPDLSKISSAYTLSSSLDEAASEIVEGASSEAVTLLGTHQSAHIHLPDDSKKQFLADSVDALGSKDATNCALCGQSIAGDSKTLVDAMFAIFSQDYLRLRQKVRTAIQELDTDHVTIATQIGASVESAGLKYVEWLKYITTLPAVYSLVEFDEKSTALEVAAVALTAKLEEKNDDPSAVITDELLAYREAMERYILEIDNFNESVDVINEQIRLFKEGLSTAAKDPIIKEITNLQNQIIRSSPVAIAFAEAYTQNLNDQLTKDAAHKKALQDFGIAQKAVIDEHAEMINDVLRYCGAKFRLSGIAQGTRTGSTEPYIDYSITLSGGGTESEMSAASAMSEILSEGEKNLLAFAFFWSLVGHMDITKTITIFDDPLSSIDSAWRKQLVDKLNELLENGLQQLFIMTHYADFARMAANAINQIKQLTVKQGSAATGNTIEIFDIEAEYLEMQFARIIRLQEYVNDPTTSRPEDIQVEIRKCLECALKNKYYLKLKDVIGSRWLRDFIEHEDVKLLLVANGSYGTLSTLCNNGGFAHHDNPATFIFDEDQALSYAQQTLDVIEKL